MSGCWESVIARSGAAPPIVVGSSAVLLSGLLSPPPPTVATLIPFFAPGSTMTRVVMTGNDTPGPRLSDRRHVTL
jgi:hypothetical protein